MPVIKFDQTNNSTASNKASCTQFVQYLSKEDMEKGFDKEFFFNQMNDMITSAEVKERIDKNRLGLGLLDAKFYTGSINFSEQELAFLGNDLHKIKSYTIKVMKEYARNFNKSLSIDDINWFAKIETNRYFKGTDPEVKNGEKYQGEVKPGNNFHVHFIIGRKTVDNKRKLSPITNHQGTNKGPVKGGFSRDQFYENCERMFDQTFQYNRPFEESYASYKTDSRGTLDEKSNFFKEKAESKVLNEQYKFLNNSEKINRLNRLISYTQFGIHKDVKYAMDGEKIIDFEKSCQFNGCVYRSLVNLAFRMKNGFKPESGSLTELILANADHMNTQMSLIQKDHKDLPLIPKIEEFDHVKDQDLPQGNWIPSVENIRGQESEFDEPLWLRKKKRKKRNDFDM